MRARASRHSMAVAVVPAVLSLLVAAPPASGQDWQTVSASRRSSGETELEVSVQYGAGRLEIGGADEGTLYSVSLRHDPESTRSITEYEQGRLRVGVESLKSNRGVPWKEGGELSLALGPGRPIDLAVEFGAGDAELNLGGIALSDLTMKTGASDARLDMPTPNPVPMRKASFEVGAASFEAHGLGNLNAEGIDVQAGVGSATLDFTGEWQRDSHVTLHMGMGSLRLLFPVGLGVKVEQGGFLASFDGEGLVQRGDAYYSSAWNTSDRKITVDIHAAFGSTTVEWIR
jgi:hypothetical protein